jgi:hypothetical protein
MAETESTPTRHDLEAKIVKRCWENKAFRLEFTADPAGAFVKYLNIPAGTLPKIVVHEESAGSWHIVLPAKPANADQLSDQDLERVAAGAGSVIVITSVRVGASALASIASAAGISAGVSASVMRGW